VYLNQRAKARDTATKADVSRVGKEIAAFYVDGTGSLTIDDTTTTGSATVKSGATVVATLKLTSGTALQAIPFTATTGSESATWCVAFTNDSGGQKTYTYSATAGLATGACP
jgi:hypothetical protein